jgi:tight adherence protein C
VSEQIVIFVCTFGAVVLLGYFVSLLIANPQSQQIRDRLGVTARPARRRGPGLMALFQRAGQAASQPFMPTTREKQSGIRRNLARAGIYSPSALKMMAGCKVIFLCAGILGGYLLGLAWDMLLLGLSVGGIVGYLLPTLWLRMKIQTNQRSLNHGLADALDLMVVCVEAGLTVDAAMQRVGQELGLVHPALSRELGITHMETRVGLARTEALRNLGHRTGNSALQSLAAMLIQADRFGTSIASALRIHADTLRQNRQHAAEEMAAKASVKMTFPLVLFIFPATFIILAGPTVLKMMQSPLFN